jgi:hypothetical protein
MENAISQLQRIGIKLFVGKSSSFTLRELVPVYHRWIQQHAIEGLPIDVADYQHVPSGPGVMLVAHEGNYAMDLGGGRTGLLYYRKQPVAGSLSERLTSIARTVLLAAKQLGEEPSLAGRIEFPGNELQLIANDRLLAPNSEETLAAIAPSMNELVGKLFDGAKCEILREQDPGERFSVNIRAPQPVAVAQLLARIEA